jgi:hypothetical protein
MHLLVQDLIALPVAHVTSNKKTISELGIGNGEERRRWPGTPQHNK